MSVVTNVVLTTSLFDSGEVEKLDDWLRERGYGPLLEVSAGAGGSKAMEVCLYAAAYNHFPAEEFGLFARALPWRIPEGFCLLLQTECWPVRVVREHPAS